MQVTGSNENRISIQLSLNGISYETESCARSEWLGAGCIKTLPQFQQEFASAQISLFTPQFTLVPSNLYDEANSSEFLSSVVSLDRDAEIKAIEVPQYDAVALYSVDSIFARLLDSVTSNLPLADNVQPDLLPESVVMLGLLPQMEGYNKIIASYDGWHLYLAIAQGNTLSLCSVYEAADFVTAEYYIFLAMNKLQLNPQVSVINFRTRLTELQEMSLANYFKSVVQL